MSDMEQLLDDLCRIRDKKAKKAQKQYILDQLTRLKVKTDECLQAVGLLITLYPSMEIDGSDIMGMATKVERYVLERIAELELKNSAYLKYLADFQRQYSELERAMLDQMAKDKTRIAELKHECNSLRLIAENHETIPTSWKHYPESEAQP